MAAEELQPRGLEDDSSSEDSPNCELICDNDVQDVTEDIENAIEVLMSQPVSRNDGSEFGESVTMNGIGNIGLAGSSGENFGTVLEKTSDGDWNQTQTLDGGHENQNAHVETVTIDEESAIVGTWPPTMDKGNFEAFNTESGNETHDFESPHDDAWGYSADFNGRYAILGMNDTDEGDSDKALVYKNKSSGWEAVDTLTTTDPDNEGDFGYSVAINNNWAVVGAPTENKGTGMVFIFKRTDQNWKHRKTFFGETQDRLGNDVDIAIDPTTKAPEVIAGAPLADNGGTERGLAYVYKLDTLEDKWVQQQKLEPVGPTLDENFPSPQDRAHFGASVSLTGDIAIVGEPLRDDDGHTDQGMVHLFEGSTNLAQVEELDASDARDGDQYGHDVALDKETIIVGAPYNDFESYEDLGSAYIYE